MSPHRFVLPIFLTFAALASGGTGCSSIDERAEESFRKGKAALEAGDPTAASAWLTEVVESAPDFVPARFLRAEALFQLGRYAEARSDYETCESSNELAEEEIYPSKLKRARCSLELARQAFPDTEFRWDSTPADARRRARDLILEANLALTEVVETHPEAYDANLWRGYALLRLGNYQKAKDVLRTCEGLDRSRWEHRFFLALALEGLYKVNVQSLEYYFEIVNSGPRPEIAPVYEYIARIVPETAPEPATKLAEAVEAFATAVPQHSPRIDAFLAEWKSKRDSERRGSRAAESLRLARELLEKRKYEEAASTLEAFEREEGEAAEVKALLVEVRETWSIAIEAATEELVKSGRRDDLRRALADYEKAKRLTNKVERLVSVQQRINAVELALARHDSSERLQQLSEISRAGKHQEVLDSLASVSLQGLSRQDADLYHYLRGVASWHLGQWSAASREFGLIEQRNFADLDKLEGLALLRSGQEQAGSAILSALPAESRDDEVNRALGLLALERNDHARASTYLGGIKEQTAEDSRNLFRAHREVGLACYRREEYLRAIEELQAARRIVEMQTHDRVTDLYLYLGNAYYRLDDLERAKRAYQDLSDTKLSPAERRENRELHLYRGWIHLREKHPDLAYADLAEFVRLGGTLPEDGLDAYGRLTATYADYVPLDRVQSWSYVSTATDYNFSLYVKARSGDAWTIERREGKTTSEETWTRQGIYLVRQVGDHVVKLPVNLNPAEEKMPLVVSRARGEECIAEVVSIRETVEVQNGRRFTDCIKVRVRRTGDVEDGRVHSAKDIYYFAPDVGEVKREVYRDDVKVSEIVLADFTLKSAS